MNIPYNLYLGQQVALRLDDKPSYVYNRTLIAVGGVGDEPYVKLRLGPAGAKQYVHSVLLRYDNVRLLLRRLDSMTEDEMSECGNLDYDFTGEPGLNKWTWNQFDTLLTANQFTWLLARGFDLFGLIDSGNAIDKDKTPDKL